MAGTRKTQLPSALFCPRCNQSMPITRLNEKDFEAMILKQGFDEGGRGICRCGIVAVLCIKNIPKSPTFSLFFDIYMRGNQTSK